MDQVELTSWTNGLSIERPSFAATARWS